MKIYIAHPANMDYENEIYEPLRNDSFFSRHELIFPHEESSKIINTRDDYRNVDIVIAECSRPSTGVGIELGWFYDEKKPIYCFYKTGMKPSGSVAAVAKEVIEYYDSNDLVNKIKNIIENK
ncbi:hypothetical protein IK146_01145 [Candidatus Saccharibacteria bacterium]|nr:hypothetical protein [Candidatus Saccharibacteria bacterium]